jgi:hypothetical protein
VLTNSFLDAGDNYLLQRRTVSVAASAVMVLVRVDVMVPIVTVIASL